MYSSPKKAPLGAVLQQAGLVSADNIKEALRQQRENVQDRRIGEILASQGHINSQTADFFAESWSILIEEKFKQPIGQYFKLAGLLSEQQIEEILARQKISNLKFGEQAVAGGWLNKTTVDFFVKSLTVPIEAESYMVNSIGLKQSKFSEIKSNPQVKDSFYKIKLKLLNLEDKGAYSEKVLEKVLLWTQGQSFLTKKLFQLIAENQSSIIAEKEIEHVNYLVQTKILENWRQGAIGEHLQNIEKRLLANRQIPPNKLLRLYRKVLEGKVFINSSEEQQALITTGLVLKQQNKLVVANSIYESVFNFDWIAGRLREVNEKDNSVVPIHTINSNKIISTAKGEPKKSSLFKNLLLLLALIALLSVFFNSLHKRIKVRTAFKQGNKFLRQKSFTEAIAEYNKLLNIDSNYFQAWTNRGYALAGLQKYDEMRESCTTATIIEPTAVYAWNCQGEALHNLKRTEEAISSFDKAISLKQTDPIFLINKSEALKALDKEEESLSTINRAIEVLEQIEAIQGKEKVSNEFAVALTFLANGYRKQEKYESAISNYNRALEYSPDYFPAKLGKGIVFNRRKQHQQAQTEFENILTNKELSAAKQAQTWFYLGQSLCQSQQKVASVEAFERAIDLKPEYEAAKQARENCRP